jgi:hypothetical protein
MSGLSAASAVRIEGDALIGLGKLLEQLASEVFGKKVIDEQMLERFRGGEAIA